jgi:dihydrofolate reductase
MAKSQARICSNRRMSASSAAQRIRRMIRQFLPMSAPTRSARVPWIVDCVPGPHPVGSEVVLDCVREAGRCDKQRPRKELLCRQPFSTCPCPSTGSSPGPNESVDNPAGDGGDRLHDWLFASGEPAGPSGMPGLPAGVNGRVFDELIATGAVVAGRGTFEPAAGWGGDHHDGVPIFILSRQGPGIETEQWPLVTCVSDVETAMNRARQAGGERNVLVHGATGCPARARGRAPRRARDPSHPRAPRPGPPSLRQTRF